MLSIGVLGAGSERYYLRSTFDAIDEYYVRGEEHGYWMGKGAASLGLSGEVAAEKLHAVLDGRSPFDGESMLAGSASKGRSRPGFDLTFSAPKGVSLLGLLGEPATATEVIAAHTSAVGQALGYLERDATFVRRGHAGERKEVGQGLIGAGFMHVTSRLGDPQLHTHVLVANLVQGGDGNWSAPDGRALYHHSRTTGFLYQAALRAELTERLGLAWGPVRQGLAEPAAFRPEVLRHFSRRRAEIETAMEGAGSTSAQAAQVATFQTRAPKDHSVERSVLVGSWRLRAEGLGVDREYLRSLAGPGREPEVPPMNCLSAELLGPDGLTLHASTFGRQEVLRGLAEAVPEGARVSAVEAMAAQVLSDERAVELGADSRGPRWSTAELMATERALISSAVAARSAGRAVPGKANIALALAGRPGLADEQIAAVQRLTGGGEGLSVLVGPAGTGKTFVLDAARAAWASNDIYLVEGGSFEVDSHAPDISERDAVNDLSASLSRSRAHELATEVSSEAGTGHRPGHSLSERPRSELAEAEPVAGHSAEREALASMLGPEPQERALHRRWEKARAAVERHLARRDANGRSHSADEGRWLALERHEVERAINMARPARAREHSIGEDIGP